MSHLKKKKGPTEKNIKNEPRKFQERILSLFRFNISFKLTLEFTITFISFVILINMLFYVGIKTYIYLSVVDEMKKVSSVFESGFYEDYDKMLDHEGLQYFIYNSTNKVLLSSNVVQPVMFDQHVSKIPIITFLQRHIPKWFYYHTEIIQEDGMDKVLFLRKDAAEYHEKIDFFLIIALCVSAILLLLIWISLSRISRKHLQPIKVMTRKVQEISITDLSARLDIRGTKDELKDLAATFNNMMNEIENSYEKQKQFVSDASHELRTPIAVIKGYANMVNRWGKEDPSVLEESLKAIEDESRQMQSLVESLLFLARHDKGTMEMKKEAFNIKAFLIEIVKEFELIDQKHMITTEYEYDGNLYASPDKLKQAIRIFIDNSIKYTPDQGQIKIALKGSEHHIYISIQDDGIGISDEDLPHIFERFYRADQARTRNQSGGSGLGLSIAQMIIDQHDGMINVESKMEEGTKVTIILPH